MPIKELCRNGGCHCLRSFIATPWVRYMAIQHATSSSEKLEAVAAELLLKVIDKLSAAPGLIPQHRTAVKLLTKSISNRVKPARGRAVAAAPALAAPALRFGGSPGSMTA